MQSDNTEKAFGSDGGYVHYFDCPNAFEGIYIGKSSQNVEFECVASCV